MTMVTETIRDVMIQVTKEKVGWAVKVPQTTIFVKNNGPDEIIVRTTLVSNRGYGFGEVGYSINIVRPGSDIKFVRTETPGNLYISANGEDFYLVQINW